VTNLNDEVIDDLNFSCDTKSWFDLWHLHVDDNGKGNTDWSLREKSLEELVRLFHKLNEKLKEYPNQFQLWIEVYDNDCEDDAIYIHTKNPNSENFPTKFPTEFPPDLENERLKGFLAQQGLSLFGQKMMEGNVYFLYDKHVGLQFS